MSSATLSAGCLGGHLETILLKILSLKDCYGYSLYKTITSITGHCFELKEASLYSSLRRLEAERFISSYWGDETQGARRKYYSITQEGAEYLNGNIEKWRITKHVMECIISSDISSII